MGNAEIAPDRGIKRGGGSKSSDKADLKSEKSREARDALSAGVMGEGLLGGLEGGKAHFPFGAWSGEGLLIELTTTGRTVTGLGILSMDRTFPVPDHAVIFGHRKEQNKQMLHTRANRITRGELTKKRSLGEEREWGGFGSEDIGVQAEAGAVGSQVGEFGG